MHDSCVISQITYQYFVSLAWLLRLWEVTSSDGIAVIVSPDGCWDKDTLHTHLGNRWGFLSFLENLYHRSCMYVQFWQMHSFVKYACVWAICAHFVGVWNEGMRAHVLEGKRLGKRLLQWMFHQCFKIYSLCYVNGLLAVSLSWYWVVLTGCTASTKVSVCCPSKQVQMSIAAVLFSGVLNVVCCFDRSTVLIHSTCLHISPA